MELREANRILQSVKAALSADGVKLPSSAETDGIMLLLGKLDANRYLAAAHSKPSRPAVREHVTFCRALTAVKAGLPDPVTYMSVMMLHKTLYGDFSADAGRPRVFDASTGGSAHTDPKYITGSLKSIIAKMNELASAPEMSKDDFAGYLTHYMRELIILHPFDRGTEFTLRMYMIMFCRQKGFALCYNRISPLAIKKVEETAFLTDDITPMYKMFVNCLSYERTAVSPPAAAHSKREAEHRKPRKTPPVDTSPSPEIAAAKRKAAQDKKADIDDIKLKRIIRLQQKISKLNEQLATELSDGIYTDDE